MLLQLRLQHLQLNNNTFFIENKGHQLKLVAFIILVTPY
jgi:hypothetical protein